MTVSYTHLDVYKRQEIFGVQVRAVNTISMKGKQRRVGVHRGYRPDWKKAIVTLQAGSKPIELFE